MGRRKSLDISMKEIILEHHDKCVTQQVIACTLKINLWIQKSDFIVGHRPAEEEKELQIVVISELSTELLEIIGSAHPLLTGNVCLNLMSTSAWQSCKEE